MLGRDSGTLGREGMLGRTARQELAEVDGAGMEQRQGLRNLDRLSSVVLGYVHRHSLRKGAHPKGMLTFLMIIRGLGSIYTEMEKKACGEF